MPLASDPDHKLMEPAGAWGEKTLYGKKSVGVKRSTLVVDTDGTVLLRWKSVKAAGHAQSVLNKTKALLGKK